MKCTLINIAKTAAVGLAVIVGANTASAETKSQSRQTTATSIEIAQARLPRLDTVIKAHCDGEIAVFRIYNQGAKWPKMGLVQIIGPDGSTVLVKRKMRFAKNQSATMRYKKAGQHQEGVSLYIDPSWDPRGRSAVKHLRCS